MKRARLFAIAATALLAACFEPTAPAGLVDLLLTGTWSTGPIPSGSYTSLSIRAASGQITGTGQEQQLCCTHRSFTVSGDYSPTSGSFTIGVTYPGGETRTFDGTVQGPDSLVGSWVMPGVLGMRVVFYRQADPPCADSAPLLGSYDPAAPGFIVRFQDTVNATAEAARLGALYGFTATHVYEVAIKGFAALLSPATVAVLRCEPKVTYIEYDAVVTIAG